MKAAPTFRLR